MQATEGSSVLNNTECSPELECNKVMIELKTGVTLSCFIYILEDMMPVIILMSLSRYFWFTEWFISWDPMLIIKESRTKFENIRVIRKKWFFQFLISIFPAQRKGSSYRHPTPTPVYFNGTSVVWTKKQRDMQRSVSAASLPARESDFMR